MACLIRSKAACKTQQSIHRISIPSRVDQLKTPRVTDHTCHVIFVLLAVGYPLGKSRVHITDATRSTHIILSKSLRAIETVRFTTKIWTAQVVILGGPRPLTNGFASFRGALANVYILGEQAIYRCRQ